MNTETNTLEIAKPNAGTPFAFSFINIFGNNLSFAIA
jgi:hypothetical protein